MKLWRVQKFFGDVVYDLRSRGLLPVVILLVGAMVAVPVLITRGSSGSSAPALQASAVPVETAPETQNAVVTYAPPALREYKKRLDGESPKNPFAQPSDGGAGAGGASASQLNSTVTTPTQTGSTSSSSTGTSVSSSTGSSPVESSTGGTRHRIRYFHSVADLSVGEAGQPLTRHRKTKNFTALPSDAAPVMVYLGSTLDGKRAVFSVSKYADQFSGPGTCGPGPSECTLLALGVGESEQMLYTVDGKSYVVKINAIRRVFTNKPPTG